MSLNNVTSATGLVPQLAAATNSMGGQILIIPNYYGLRPMLEPHPGALPPPHPYQNIQHRFMHHQQHQFLAAPAPTPPQSQTNHVASNNISLTSNGNSTNHVNNHINTSSNNNINNNNNNSINNHNNTNGTNNGSINNNSVGSYNNAINNKSVQHNQVTQPQSKEQTNAKIRNIKEKCISHYIDGQLIIETSKPLTEKKLKTSKKRKLQQQQQQQPQKKRHNQHMNQSHQQQTTTHLNNHQQQHQAQLPIQHQPIPAPHMHPIQHASLPSPQLNTPIQTPQPLPHHSSHMQTSTPLAQHLPIMPAKVQPPNLSQQSPQQQPQQSRQMNHSISQHNNSGSQNQQTSSSEVQRLRAEMPNWSVDEVVKFIERHEDIRQYSNKFAEDEVDGKALQLMIDRNLNFQILTSMFKHGPAMKIEATLSKYKVSD